MRCRQCGTEIANNALICYKCGIATTEAKFKPLAPRKSGSRLTLVMSVLSLLLLVLLALYLGRLPSGDSSPIVRWVAVGVAVLIVALRAYARRRR
jgi:hypothetical protein